MPESHELRPAALLTLRDEVSELNSARVYEAARALRNLITLMKELEANDADPRRCDLSFRTPEFYKVLDEAQDALKGIS
jgi:hypothetical protein